MTRVWLMSLIVSSCVFLAKTEECVVYDFEDSEDLISSDKAFCSSFSAWSLGSYEGVGVESPNANSTVFISPTSTLSCWSTSDFTLSPGGIVEIHAYLKSEVDNQISILVFETVPSGSDAVIATTHSGSESGWQTIKIDSIAGTSVEGYIVILGMAADDAIVLVNSVKYKPPNVKCDWEEEETTEDVCVTYNFETDFDVLFTDDNYLCAGLPTWHLDNYTSVDIEAPNNQSTVFMTPQEQTSCIASFVFKMSPGGIVEANIYMDPVSTVDHIIVLAQKVTGREYDTVAGFKKYYPQNNIFVTGWNVLRFSLLDSESFEGYLIFIGGAENSSTVLVDSVRYIPPNTSADEDAACSIYENAEDVEIEESSEDLEENATSTTTQL